MFEKVSQSLKYNSKIFLVHKHIQQIQYLRLGSEERKFLVDIDRAEGEVIINHKIPMTVATVLVEDHHITLIHKLYNRKTIS